ncbi:GNAT family N-acetyltransferase [Brevibacillus sp. SYP-B805]|uniref:GNAT family N-acetyltransferase n=1 Tax=Brevibacillus sp. SYP-B805 TaxID=1578199 RepID=UPI0013EC9289|nr:GNAT family N-acetyltransferase [Brevibacillus sp. SYP-B805]NGQ96281.1 GNAT family N-acetyltransferase [Brevibacillus sp. SYP-B805]
MAHIESVTLEGKHVRLVPLEMSHAEQVWQAGRYPEIWAYTLAQVETLEDAKRYIRQALEGRQAGNELPFAILERASGELIGSTRYYAISLAHKGLEIGYTWLTPRVWKSPVNTECKWLLLRHAFEELGMIRVQFRTDLRNENSQRAIARIGGVREGVLRNHMIVRNGYVRDSVIYSIIDREWPEVDRRLRAILER